MVASQVIWTQRHGHAFSGSLVPTSVAQAVLWPVQRQCQQRTWHSLHLQPEQHTQCTSSYHRRCQSRRAAAASIPARTAMAEASLPAAAMPGATGVLSEFPAAPSKVLGGASGATPAAAAATYSAVLGTHMALDQIHKVKMHVSGKCGMGISFWPSFSLKPPEREPQCGTATLVPNTDAIHPASSSSAAAAGTGAAAAGGAGASAEPGVDGSSDSRGAPAPATATAAGEGGGAAAAGCSCSHLLHINFTRDPPDEVPTGAKFLGCIPFPFLTIRTNKLEGTIDPCSGAVTLQFEAAMLAQVGSKPPTPLPLSTCLTSEAASAFKVTLQGQRMADGRVTLVSAAEVPKTSSRLANIILWLPTAATAIMPMRLEFLQ